MDKAKILQMAQTELMKHSRETFVDNPPSIAQGGSGVVVMGCPRCRKKLQTVTQFMEHLASDVLPGIVEKL